MDWYKFLLFIAVSSLSLIEGQNTSAATPSTNKLSDSALLAAIIVPSVVGGLIIIAILVFIFIKIREKRQTEGTYRPSNEERKEPRVEPNAGLKLPPEERLI